jgi:uracil-DNA glycosylase
MDDKDDNPQLSFDLEKNAKKVATDEAPTMKSEIRMAWVCHPAKRNYRTTGLVALFIVILVIVVYYATYSIWFSILAFIILAGSLAGFFLPTRYTLSDDEIVVKTTMQTVRKKWAQFRSYYPDKNGVLLSPFPRPSRLENFRGVYLRFWYNRDDVVDFVSNKIKTRKPPGEE